MNTSFQRVLLLMVAGAICGLALCVWNPVNATQYRLGLLVCLLGVWLGCLLLLWKNKSCRFLFGALALIAVLPFCLPSGNIDQQILRASYLKRMQTLEGVSYHWGGESSRGIDCSGLPRKAYRDALWAYGIQNVNGSACRMFVEQWWFDTSARALGEGYRGFTVEVKQGGNIKEMSYEKLEPGDLAVTVSGVHVLVYLGRGQWIQADPGAGSVINLHGRKNQNPWFSQPVTIHRWATFAK